mmetsp:Transcript_16936/g.46360  ORF Transcript_16936/g.46360 Transcript_16936/m.46360 type:complete len:85 (+) Transcript_16936:845-1099(+)
MSSGHESGAPLTFENTNQRVSLINDIQGCLRASPDQTSIQRSPLELGSADPSLSSSINTIVQIGPSSASNEKVNLSGSKYVNFP